MFKYFSVLVLLLAFTSVLIADPGYYNYNNGTSYNSFPFNQGAGKRIQLYIAPGEFNQPGPVPSGNITKFSVRISTGYPLGPVTYSNFRIIFIDSTLSGNTMAAGWYLHPNEDTVFYRASHGPISAPASTWLDFTLDHPHAYNNTKGLVIAIEQTAASGTFSGFSLQHTTTPTYRRHYSVGGAPFVYSNRSLYVPNCGVDVSQAPAGIVTTLCRNGINVAVPDNTPGGARDTIRMIGNNNCVLQDINVRIDTFPHTWISDMQFRLTHNGSTPVNLFLNRGGSGDNIINCVFDDSAAQPISAGTAPFTGSWRPEQPLSAYNTQTPQGSWELFMVDQFAGDLGFLRAWCIVFQYSCPTGGVITKEVPFSYRLNQNYPNPFNPVTTIKYGLPKYGHTKLFIYDVLGRVVSTLVDEFKDAGTYTVNFDASNLSSGIYFYTLESGSFKETKKMMLVK